MTLRMNSVVDCLILESQCCSRKRCESGNLRDLSDSEVHPIRKCASGLVRGRLNRRNSSSGTVLIEVLRTEAEELLKDRHLSRNCTASANGTARGRKNLEQKVVWRQKHRNLKAPGIAHLHCRHVAPLTQQLHISKFVPSFIGFISLSITYYTWIIEAHELFSNLEASSELLIVCALDEDPHCYNALRLTQAS